MLSYWSVSASWYDCNPGSGACATCDRSKLGMAYPYLSGHPPNYANCSAFVGLPQHSCGDIIHTGLLCPIDPGTGGTGVGNIPIVDHGPGAACRCEVPHCYCPTCTCASNLDIHRLIDLTKAAFLQLGRPLSEGLEFVSVYI
jgi:hypothetical protein